MKKILVILALASALFLFGCLGSESRNETTQRVLLGESFTIQPGVIYQVNNEYQFSVISFSDSRCPSGVQCVWQGEQSVLLRVTNMTPLCPTCTVADFNVSVGEVNETADVIPTGWRIELESINSAAKTARITVNDLDQIVPVESAWFSIAPKQCGQNDWQEWDNQTGFSETKRFVSPEAQERAVLEAWLASQGIVMKDYASRTTDEIVCEACNCPSGREIAVLIDQEDFTPMRSLVGWTQLPPSACTMEAKICSDGSAVGRVGPWCQFPPCPNMAVPFRVTLTHQPGFIMNPTITTIVIDSNGWVTKTTEQLHGVVTVEDLNKRPQEYVDQNLSVEGRVEGVNCTKIGPTPQNPYPNQCHGRILDNGFSVGISGNERFFDKTNGQVVRFNGEWEKNGDAYVFTVGEKTKTTTLQISLADVDTLKQLITENQFFDVNAEDIRTCIADIPTRDLKVEWDNRFNEVTHIGAECDQNQTLAIRAIMDRVDELAGTPAS